MTKCPKCGKDAWTVTVKRHSLKGLDRQTYVYLRYRHYAGSRKSITLKALEKLLEGWVGQRDEIMRLARLHAGEKTVDHYVRQR